MKRYLIVLLVPLICFGRDGENVSFEEFERRNDRGYSQDNTEKLRALMDWDLRFDFADAGYPDNWHRDLPKKIIALVELGADPNVCECGKYDLARAFNYVGDDYAMAELLIKNGADPRLPCSQYQGGPFVYPICRVQSAEMARLLESYGADTSVGCGENASEFFKEWQDSRREKQQDN